MSTYLTRTIEVRRPLIKKCFYDFKQLEEIKNLKEGDVYRTTKDGYKYWKVINENGEKKFSEINSPEYKWNILKWWTVDNDDYEENNEDETEKPVKLNVDGKETFLRKHTEFCDNGGYIRDKYISRWNNPYGFSDRGWPDDISPESKDKKKKTDEWGCWGYTYATLDELCSTREKEELLFKEEIQSFINEAEKNELNKKVDAIIKKLSEPSTDIQKILSKNKKNNEDEEEYFEDTLDYLLSYDGHRGEIDSLNDEITKVYSLVDSTYGWVNEKDIRILYYFS